MAVYPGPYTSIYTSTSSTSTTWIDSYSFQSVDTVYSEPSLERGKKSTEKSPSISHEAAEHLLKTNVYQTLTDKKRLLVCASEKSVANPYIKKILTQNALGFLWVVFSGTDVYSSLLRYISNELRPINAVVLLDPEKEALIPNVVRLFSYMCLGNTGKTNIIITSKVDLDRELQQALDVAGFLSGRLDKIKLENSFIYILEGKWHVS